MLGEFIMKLKKSGFIKEFKNFIMRGNVLDMAVGVIVAGAFTKITTSLVNDVFMPFIGWLIGDIDLTQINIVLAEATADKPAVVIGIGTFIATIIDFLLIAFVIFLVIKIMAKAKEIAEKRLLKQKEAEAVAQEPKGPTTEELLAQILEEIKKDK